MKLSSPVGPPSHFKEDLFPRTFFSCRNCFNAVKRAMELRRRGIRSYALWLERRVLSEDTEEGRRRKSELEEIAIARFTRWGVAELVEFEVPHPAFPGTLRRADAICRLTQVVFEFDSRQYHQREEAFQNDRARDARTAEIGWRTARLTWEDFHRRNPETRRLVRRLCGLDGGAYETLPATGRLGSSVA